MGCGASTVAPGVDVTSAGTNGHELSKASNGTGHPGPRASEPVATRKPEMSRSKTELLKPDRRSEGDGAGAPGLSWTPEQVTSRPRSMSLQPASSFSQGDSPTSFSRVSLAQDGSFAGGSSSGGSDNGAESSPRSARKTRSMSYTRNRSMSVQSKDPVLRFTEYVQAEEHKKQRKHGRIVMSSPQTEVQMRAQMDKLKTTNNLPDHEAELILGTIRGHFLFNRLTPASLMQVVSHIEKIKMASEEPVVEQGEQNAEHMYIVCDGSYQVEVTKVAGEEPLKVARLTKGAAFGEMALLHNTQRTATVRCLDEGHVFRLSRAAYLLIVMEGGENGEPKVIDAPTGSQKSSNSNKEPQSEIEKAVPWLFESLGDTSEMNEEHLKEYRTLLKAVQDLNLEPKELAFGHEADTSLIGPALVIVVSGELSFQGDPNKASRDDGVWRVSAFGDLCADTTLTPGDVLGIGSPGDEGLLAVAYARFIETEGQARGGGDFESFKSFFRKRNQLRLLGGSRHRCRVRATERASLAILPLKNYMCMMPITDHLLSSTDAIRSLLLNAPWCRFASSKEVDQMAFSFKPAVVSAGAEVATVGAETAFLTLMLSGTIRVGRMASEGKEAIVCECVPGDVIGERSVAESVPSLVTARASEACVVLQLPREAYRSLNLSSLNERAEKKGVGAVHAQIDAPRVAGASDATLDDFSTVAVIGAGAFASVGLVEHKTTKEVYVMKKMSRERIESSNMQKQMIRERLALGLLNHPTIAKLYATFMSSQSLYMLVEPCMGGELYCYMREVNVLEEEPASFYTACVVSALEHMHAYNIMYRDLKPENLVIASNGFAKVVDFGFAKRTRSRTFTLCGTPEYLAPELILMKGHGTSVDWWAVGVLLYEMLMGAAPFVWIDGEPYYNMPPTDLYRNILNPQYQFHLPPLLSVEVVDLIRHLLAWHPLRRLGCLTDGADDIKRHDFFQGCRTDWIAMYNATVPPPLKPELSSPTDTAHFDEALQDDKFFGEGAYMPEPGAWDASF